MYIRMIARMLKKILYYADFTIDGKIIIIKIDDKNDFDFNKCIRLDMAIGILEQEYNLKLIPDDETNKKSNFTMNSPDLKVYFSFTCNDKLKK